jgi:hypothetical protein
MKRVILWFAIIHLTDPSELISNLCYSVLEAEGSWKIHERHVGSFVFLRYFYCRWLLKIICCPMSGKDYNLLFALCNYTSGQSYTSASNTFEVKISSNHESQKHLPFGELSKKKRKWTIVYLPSCNSNYNFIFYFSTL